MTSQLNALKAEEKDLDEMLEAETADLEDLNELSEQEKQKLVQELSIDELWNFIKDESSAEDEEEKEIEELAMKLEAKKAIYEENQLKMAQQSDAFDAKKAKILHEIEQMETRNKELELRDEEVKKIIDDAKMAKALEVEKAKQKALDDELFKDPNDFPELAVVALQLRARRKKLSAHKSRSFTVSSSKVYNRHSGSVIKSYHQDEKPKRVKRVVPRNFKPSGGLFRQSSFSMGSNSFQNDQFTSRRDVKMVVNSSLADTDSDSSSDEDEDDTVKERMTFQECLLKKRQAQKAQRAKSSVAIRLFQEKPPSPEKKLNTGQLTDDDTPPFDDEDEAMALSDDSFDLDFNMSMN